MPGSLIEAYQLPTKEVAKNLETDVLKGLTNKEAEKRLAQFGENRLDLHPPESLIKILFRQFISPMVWVLLLAAMLAFFFQEWLEGIAILVVILINAIIGFFMEWQALRSLEALRSLSEMKARVFRDNQLIPNPASQLVPGDLIFLEAGDVIPADSRITEQVNLGVKEAALTGESTQVKKQVEALKTVLPLADRRNLLFKGTTVTRGNVKAIVTATGMSTELGKITHLAQEATKASTPLEKKLLLLSQKLLILTLLLALIILAIGLLQGRDIQLTIETAIALAIAAIPEGLPIVATVALAKGMLRLSRHKVIVKKLSAVETLGETEVIFTDKTGTLTENRLSADTLIFDSGKVNIFFDQQKLQFADSGLKQEECNFAFEQLLRVGVLCNNAQLSEDGNPQHYSGDPLELALLELARGYGWDFKDIKQQYPRLKEIPFDSDSKMMGTLHKNEQGPGYLACVKGAQEVILTECDYVLTQQGSVPLEDRRHWIESANSLASKGLRILALAYSEVNKKEEQFFHNLTLIGLIGFLDPPRLEIKEAIQECRQAGIRVVMVTGDHPETARNIALKTGLIEASNAAVIHGQDLEPIENTAIEIDHNLLKAKVFARVSPAQKLALIHTYQNQGCIVGMTGDGINDAPALKKADIGIAMGQRGTEAAKEVADLILENDAFTSIVLAIKQGRGIFENIRHFVVYLLSCNLSELLVVAIASLANLASPLLPLQILFLNMVTDVFPALALGVNKEAQNVMNHPPRNRKEPIISRKIWKAITFYSVGITLSVLGILTYSTFYLNATTLIANNLAFYTLILAQLWHVFNLPKVDQSFFNNEITRNPYIWLALLSCLIITVTAYLVPTLQDVLNLQAITWQELIIVLPFSLFPVIFVQFFKRLGLIV